MSAFGGPSGDGKYFFNFKGRMPEGVLTMFEKEIGIIMDANDEKEIPAVVKQTVDAYDRIIKALEYEVIDAAKAIMQYKKLLESIKEEESQSWTNHYTDLIKELETKKVAYDYIHTLLLAFRALVIAGVDDGKDDERFVRIKELRDTLKASGSAYHYEILYKWFRSAYLLIERPRLQLEGTEISEH